VVVELKLRKIGNSLGVVLPKEVLAHLKVAEGDTICVTDTVDGSLRVGPSNDEFKKQMEAAEGVINRYRRTLRELAK
jgi:putative addiction module antidote